MGERAETLKANGTEHVQRTLQQVKSCLEIIKLPHRPKATPKIFYDERKRGREKLGEGDGGGVQDVPTVYAGPLVLLWTSFGSRKQSLKGIGTCW